MSRLHSHRNPKTQFGDVNSVYLTISHHIHTEIMFPIKAPFPCAHPLSLSPTFINKTNKTLEVSQFRPAAFARWTLRRGQSPNRYATDEQKILQSKIKCLDMRVLAEYYVHACVCRRETYSYMHKSSSTCYMYTQIVANNKYHSTTQPTYIGIALVGMTLFNIHI